MKRATLDQLVADRAAGRPVVLATALDDGEERLIWLNPLLRWSGFEAKAGGVRAMRPHVDELRPVHNIRSLVELADALAAAPATARHAA